MNLFKKGEVRIKKCIPHINKMKFAKKILSYLKREKITLFLIGITFLFYIIINFRHIDLLTKNGILEGPFNYLPFKFNIFNFDPLQYTDSRYPVLFHPFFNFIVFVLSYVKHNIFIIFAINSLIVALTNFLIYIFSRELELEKKVSFMIALLFGCFSYSITSSLVADSYVYAQFVLVLSVLYIQHSLKIGEYGIIGHAIFAFLNFGITITNVAPYGLSVLLGKCEKSKKKFYNRFYKSIALFIVIVICFTVIQFIATGYTWFSSASNHITEGGINYIHIFNFTTHFKVIYMMITAPIVTAPLTVKEDAMAIVTDVSHSMPLYINILTIIIIITMVKAYKMNKGERITKVIMSFPLVAFVLHIVIGFGLGVYEYDMYLYSGHYIFVMPMLLALLLKKQKDNSKVYKRLQIGTAIFILIILINNIIAQDKLFKIIMQTYIQ